MGSLLSTRPDLLRRRLERERKIRLEAEAIAENALRDLYESQRDVALLQRIATAANEATSVETAMGVALDEVCAYTGWPMGHVYIAAEDASGDLVPTSLWHVEDPDRADLLRKIVEATRLAPGVGLPGRVLLDRAPAWILDLGRDGDSPVAKVAEHIGFRAAFGFPVMTGAEVAAVLHFFSDVSLPPNERLLVVMGHIGFQLGRVVERARAEQSLRRSEEELRHAQKMEAIGRLAGGIAHDFNNLLSVIGGYSELLLGAMHPSDVLRDKVEQVRRATDRAAALTRQLLAFSRRQVMEPKVLDLNALLRDMQKMLSRLIGVDVELCTVEAEDLGKVKADPGQIEQVLLNLVVNARDAMPKGGKLTFETANVHLDERYPRDHKGVKPGPYVMLAVSDMGVGMTSEIQARIFEPFFTTKDRDKGTGLGLSTVYGIVKQSRGNIWVYSEPARGTTFKIYLPRVQERAEEIRPPETETRAAPCGRETVLVVEDEQVVRDLVSETLEGRGYTVLRTGDVNEALLLVGRHRGAIQLLITDVVLPGMSGRQLATSLTSFRPELKVLYMSGYTYNAILHHDMLEPGVAFLQKPFTLGGLTEKVRQILDGKVDAKP